MKKSLVLILALWYTGAYSMAQDSSDHNGLSPSVFKRVLNQQFTNLITGKSKNSIGNFASLNLKESEVSFSGCTIFPNNSVLTVKVSGAVSDGMFAIFSNSKLNTEVALGIQYNYLAPGKKSLSYLDDDTSKITGFRFGWFSVGYKIQNNSFRLIDTSAVFANQITKTNFVSHELRLQYSYYKWSSSAWESYYLCGGFAFSYGNNLSDLTTTEVSEVKYYGPNPYERTTTEKYNAYIGMYKKDIKSLRIYGDCYGFMLDENKLAFHFYPELNIRDKVQPMVNIGVGILVSFKDADDKSSVVNAEVYWNALDVFNASNSSYSLLERNKIGINFSFPIKFKTEEVLNDEKNKK